MPAVVIQGGMRVEIPNRDENRADFRQVIDDYERSRAKGVKWMEEAIPITTPATTFFQTLSQPQPGYVWSLKIVSATLASAGTLVVYKASSSGDTRRPIANVPSSTTPVATWSSNQGFMYTTQGIYIVAGQNITALYIAAEQSIAEQMEKIFD